MRAGAVVLSALLASCATGQRTEPASGLPPAGQAALIDLFRPVVEPLGLRMTRAALIDVDGDYRRSPTGRHLALYAVPTDDAPPRRYLRTLVPLTAALVGVFDRWPQLRSFDICQEPVGATGDPPEAFTRVNVPRADAAAIDWETIDLPNLLARTLAEPGGEGPSTLQVEVFGDVQADPGYLGALAEARRIVGDAAPGP